MRLRVYPRPHVVPDGRPFEVVERKGIGHPDSLADLVAETFSQRYSQWCSRNVGLVLNHAVDKIMLIGAQTIPGFGKIHVQTPVKAYLFGKITRAVGAQQAPIDSLFEETVHQVLAAATRSEEIVNHISCAVVNSAGTAADHARAFYAPENLADARLALERERYSNDTVFCVGYCPMSRAEQLAVEVEVWLNSGEFNQTYPQAGSDIKIMVFRHGTELDVIACVPCIAERTDSLATYRRVIGEARDLLSAFVNDSVSHWPELSGATPRVRINTKDQGDRIYLAPFGTSLGKGDCGAVGRGNRFAGVIAACRPSSIKAAAGKNPLSHAGKLYHTAADRIARRLFRELGVANEVTIVARNGGDLPQPESVSVDGSFGVVNNQTERRVELIVRDELSAIGDYVHMFTNGATPLEHFHRAPLKLLRDREIEEALHVRP